MSATTPLVRRVPRGRWVAVVRRDVVRRVSTSGTTWRLPLVERFAEDADEPLEMPLLLRATTRDGVSVSVAAEATVVLPRPVVGARYDDPWPAAERAAERAVSRIVAGWSVSVLAQLASSATRPLGRGVEEAVDRHGVRLVELTLLEVGISLHGSR